LRSTAEAAGLLGISVHVAIARSNQWQIEWQRALVWAYLRLAGGWSVLVFWLIREPYLRLQNLPEIHGKEKVYGSIP
jgi:hypothetical protein